MKSILFILFFSFSLFAADVQTIDCSNRSKLSDEDRALCEALGQDSGEVQKCGDVVVTNRKNETKEVKKAVYKNGKWTIQ